jgi:DNA-binding transcriptional ArsR family regulator
MTAMQTALKALAEPRRQEILRLVFGTELSAGEIASQFDISWPAVSQHLGVLKEADLVTERRDGKRRLYTANEARVDEIRAFFQSFWDTRLERLKREIETNRKDARGKRG